MDEGGIIIGIVALVIGLFLMPLGIYLHATKRGSDKTIVPYVIIWVLGALFIIGGAITLYESAKS